MPPLRAESSTVSIPPREQALAKRRAKAIKQGQSLSAAEKRARRKQVVQRPTTKGPAPRVPYLPGQEDIPHSDNDSDGESDTTDTTMLENTPEDLLAVYEGGGSSNEITPEMEEHDYDAEGEEDEDVFMEPPSYLGHTFYGSSAVSLSEDTEANNQLGLDGLRPQFDAPAPDAPDLIGNVNADELRILLDGLDNFPVDAAGMRSSTFSTDDIFPTNDHFRYNGDPPCSNGSAFDNCSSSSWQPSANANVDGQALGNTQAAGEAFAMHQLNAAVEDLQARTHPNPQSPLADHLSFAQPQINSTQRPINRSNGATTPVQIHNLPMLRSTTPATVEPSQGSLLSQMPSRPGTPPTRSIGPSQPHTDIRTPSTPAQGALAIPSTLTQSMPAIDHTIRPPPSLSRLSTPFALPAPKPHLPRARATTRELVIRARAAAGSSDGPWTVHLAPPATTPRRSHSLTDLPTRSPGINHQAVSESEDVGLEASTSDMSRPSTPVALEDTDIGLEDTSPVPTQRTQAQVRARARARSARFLNVRVHHRELNPDGTNHIPTLLDLRANARKFLKLARRTRGRGRRSGPDARPLRVGLREGALTDDQKTVMPLMQYHVLKHLVLVNPWPEDREAVLQDAQDYAEDLSGISGGDVTTNQFMDTVWSKLASLRGQPLAKIEYMMEQVFEVSTSDKSALLRLMSKDLFLYPTTDRDPSQYFRVGALGSALEIILFKSAKNLGLVFMEELCAPDNVVKCSDWHRKLRDQTAHEGVSPGAIALAAAMMYWALEKLYVGTTIKFDEQHYRPVWERYFRALVRLPHLGHLRRDLLDQMKEYYMDHWPASEPDDDDDTPAPAW